MSFGWSAGDIASAIKVVYNLIQALDDASGAANDYREAVLFLKTLLRTIEPLQQLALWNAYPDYGREIKEQVDHIQEPLKLFCAKVLKYESSLGATARAGYYRHAPRKIQWYLFMPQEVLKLKGKIESHMRLIDTMMQRLYLDLFLSSQRELPETFRSMFERIIQPNLITTIRDCQVPWSTTMSDNYRRLESTMKDMLDSNTAEHQKHISSEFAKFYEHQLNDQKHAQQNIISSLIGSSNIGALHSISSSEQSSSLEDSSNHNGGALHTNYTPSRASKTYIETRERLSLREIYYVVCLCVGRLILKSLLLALSRVPQPSRPLLATLSPKYNISFLDAIGRPPQVLPYELFRSLKVLQALISDQFRDLPGSAWVKQGRYLVMNMADNRELDETSWRRFIAPGATVVMSIYLQKLSKQSSRSAMESCPAPRCHGTWATPKFQLWVICPVCRREVLYSTSTLRSEDNRKIRKYIPNRKSDLFGAPLLEPRATSSTITAELDEDDLLGLKRITQITQEINHVEHMDRIEEFSDTASFAEVDFGIADNMEEIDYNDDENYYNYEEDERYYNYEDDERYYNYDDDERDNSYDNYENEDNYDNYDNYDDHYDYENHDNYDDSDLNWSEDACITDHDVEEDPPTAHDWEPLLDMPTPIIYEVDEIDSEEVTFTPLSSLDNEISI